MKRNISDIGQMKHQIEYLREILVDTDSGGVIKGTFSHFTTTRCKVEDMFNTEMEKRNHNENIKVKKFTHRYDSRLDTKMFIKYRGLKYKIEKFHKVGEEDRYMVVIAFNERDSRID